jgi:hypothetical protein
VKEAFRRRQGPRQGMPGIGRPRKNPKLTLGEVHNGREVVKAPFMIDAGRKLHVIVRCKACGKTNRAPERSVRNHGCRCAGYRA